MRPGVSVLPPLLHQATVAWNQEQNKPIIAGQADKSCLEVSQMSFRDENICWEKYLMKEGEGWIVSRMLGKILKMFFHP